MKEQPTAPTGGPKGPEREKFSSAKQKIKSLEEQLAQQGASKKGLEEWRRLYGHLDSGDSTSALEYLEKFDFQQSENLELWREALHLISSQTRTNISGLDRDSLKEMVRERISLDGKFPKEELTKASTSELLKIIENEIRDMHARKRALREQQKTGPSADPGQTDAKVKKKLDDLIYELYAYRNLRERLFLIRSKEKNGS